MLFDLALLPVSPVQTEWRLASGDTEGDWGPGEKAIYDKLIAKGVKPALARKMCKRAAAKANSTETSQRQPDISLVVPTNLRADARQKAADEGEAMPDGSYPIRNLGELDEARQAFGRTKPADRPMVKRFLLKRARALGASQDVIDAINAYDDSSDSDGDNN